jgi:hypothetical protein
MNWVCIIIGVPIGWVVFWWIERFTGHGPFAARRTWALLSMCTGYLISGTMPYTGLQPYAQMSLFVVFAIGWVLIGLRLKIWQQN